MARIIKGIILGLFLSVLFVSAAWAQTINAASCSANDVATALGSVSTDGTTVVIPACISGVGWGAQTAYTSGNATVDANGQLTYTSTHSLAIQGQGSTTGSDSLGNPTGYSDQTVLLYNNTAATALMAIKMTAGKYLRITGLTINQGTGGVENNGALNIGGNAQSSSCTWTSPAVTGPCLRIDHNHIHDINSAFIEVYGWIYGVADHNLMDFSAADSNGVRVYDEGYNNDTVGMGDQSWAASPNWGSGNFFFIENNTFTQSNASLGTVNDCAAGGREVIRYNTMTGGNVYVQTHEVGGVLRGCFATEIYGNNANETGTGLSPQPFHTSRAGQSLVWGNTLTDYGEVMNVFDDRDGLTAHDVPAWPNGNYGFCGSNAWTGTVNTSGTAVTAATGSFVNPHGSDTVIAGSILSINGTLYTVSAYNSSTSVTLTSSAGTQSGVSFFVYSPWDQAPTGTGYACLDQPGRGQGDLLSGSGWPSFSNRVNSATGTATWPHQAVSPIYAWANTLGTGASAYFGVDGSTFFAENRDYYLELPNIAESATFSGTAGIGSGTQAPTASGAYPNAPNCTPYVGYWDTTTQTFYQCSAPNTWTVYYTPYAYPHPLVGGQQQSVAPPSNVQAIAH
jgi:hypothetical protein